MPAHGVQRGVGGATYAGDPSGVLTGSDGSTVTDPTTGVIYQNDGGGTVWDPVFIPPRSGTMLFDDFISFPVATTHTAIGAGTIAGTAATAGRPGLALFTQSVAGVDGGALRAQATGILAGGGKLTIRWNLRIVTLSNATNNLVVRAGFGDASTYAEFIDGMWMEYDLAVNGSHNWFLCTSSNSSRTRVDTGIVAVANTFTTLEVSCNAAGTLVSGKVNGVASALTVAANIPSGASRNFGPCCMALKQLGAGTLTATVDWYALTQVFSAQR